jgi:hypothetical protein
MIFVLLGAGCFSQHDYYVDRGLVAAVQQITPAERERTAVPAQRADSRKPVFVRASTVRAWPATPDEQVRVTARRKRPTAIAGYVLTGLGVGLLAAGIGLAVQNPRAYSDGTEEQLDPTVPNAGKIVAGVGGLVTAFGGVLMAIGLTQRREEVPAGRDDIRYLK